MATTSIWPIYKRLDTVLEYASNLKKTTKKQYDDLNSVLNYAENDYKTENKLFVTGLNTNPKTAYSDMLRVKKHFGKENNIIAFHGYQSFVPGELTPETAHEVGVELADRLWGKRFQVVICTHLDRNHLHNHFVINSVSFADGKKFYNQTATYAKMRKISDNLCREYGLNVLEEKTCGKRNIDYTQFYDDKLGKNYEAIAKHDIDYAINNSNHYWQFKQIMQNLGYKITNRAGKLSIRNEAYNRNIRLERSFGEDYSIWNIQNKIYSNPKINYKSKEYIQTNNNSLLNYLTKNSHFYRLYLYYGYLLKKFPEGRSTMYITNKMRNEDSIKLDNFSNEVRLVSKYGIKTAEDLNILQDTLIDKISEYKAKRNNINQQLRRKGQIPELQSEKELIVKKLEALQKDLYTCKGAIKRENNLREFESNIKKNFMSEKNITTILEKAKNKNRDAR